VKRHTGGLATPRRSPCQQIDRRQWLRSALGAGLALPGGSWLRGLAADAARDPARKRACILLWMAGGPSQIDTFDPKPGQPTGGPLKAIDSSVPGIHLSELFPGLAKQMKHLAIVRSMSTKEGDHARATYLLRTGYVQQEPIQYPTLGSLFCKELGRLDDPLPGFVSIATRRGLNDGGFSAGYLGPDYAPLLVGNGDTDPYARLLTEKALRVPNMVPASGVDPSRNATRVGLLRSMNEEFVATRDALAARSLGSAYTRALRLMGSEARKAFDLDDEKTSVRDAYGRNLFGQGCLLARRLVERGVPFVEVSLGRVQGAFSGWDTHARNFTSLKSLCGVLDPAWSMLVRELDERGLLKTTTVVWMGEFGRTPRINPQSGRVHYPNAWSVVLGGGGIKGGQTVGETTPDGAEVKKRPVSVPDLLATVCRALGIDPEKSNLSNIGRPIHIVNRGATPIKEALA
jgi:hypothetical protein